MSPFELNTGRVPRLPGEPDVGGPTTVNQYVRKLRSLITNHQENAIRCVQKYWDAMRRRFDSNRKDVELTLGTRVLAKLTDQERAKYPCRKLAPRWSSSGTIVGMCGNAVTYDVDFGGQDVRKIHISWLLPLPAEVWGSGFEIETEVTAEPARVAKRTVIINETEDGDIHFEKRQRTSNNTPTPPSSDQPPNDPSSPPSPLAIDEPLPPAVPSNSGSAPEVPPSDTRRITIEPEPRNLEVDETTRYDVGRIHASRFVGRRKEFLVEWAGYPDPTDYTWQPRKELEEDVPRIVRQYERMERTRRIEAEQAEARARAEEQVSLRRAHHDRRRRRFARGD